MPAPRQVFSFLNATNISAALRGEPTVAGAAPRWVMRGSVASAGAPDTKLVANIVICDLEAEAALGIGRAWPCCPAPPAPRGPSPERPRRQNGSKGGARGGAGRCWPLGASSGLEGEEVGEVLVRGGHGDAEALLQRHLARDAREVDLGGSDRASRVLWGAREGNELHLHRRLRRRVSD